MGDFGHLCVCVCVCVCLGVRKQKSLLKKYASSKQHQTKAQKSNINTMSLFLSVFVW